MGPERIEVLSKLPRTLTVALTRTTTLALGRVTVPGELACSFTTGGEMTKSCTYTLDESEVVADHKRARSRLPGLDGFRCGVVLRFPRDGGAGSAAPAVVK